MREPLVQLLLFSAVFKAFFIIFIAAESCISSSGGDFLLVSRLKKERIFLEGAQDLNFKRISN